MTCKQITGKIQYTEQENSFILKLSGDVRLTLCCALDHAIEKIFQEHSYTHIIVDLTDAENLDSTSLGLLAKLSILAKQFYQLKPLLETNNSNIVRLLESMGIKDNFGITSTLPQPRQNLRDLATPFSEEFAKEKILEAHKILMEVNDTNKQTFKELVHTLESH